MAAGRALVLDGAQIQIGASTANQNISAYIPQCMIHSENLLVTTPHTFGQDGPIAEVSAKYNWSVQLEFVTDDFGASTIDGIMRGLMRAPMGSSTTGRAAISIIPKAGTGGTAENPTFSGTVLIDQWDPLGGGNVGEIVRQTRTLTGVGTLDVDDS